MATLVGDVLVSTVGMYVPPHRTGGSERAEAEWLQKNPNGEEIGYGRTYETMTFKTTGKFCTCGCGIPLIIPSELDSDVYNDAGAAQAGHMAMCRKVAAELADRPHRSDGSGA
jgi:hypothetical protein